MKYTSIETKSRRVNKSFIIPRILYQDKDSDEAKKFYNVVNSSMLPDSLAASYTKAENQDPML
jgi:hypothetical protein